MDHMTNLQPDLLEVTTRITDLASSHEAGDGPPFRIGELVILVLRFCWPDCHFAERLCPQIGVSMFADLRPIVADACGNIETNAERSLARNG